MAESRLSLLVGDDLDYMLERLDEEEELLKKQSVELRKAMEDLYSDEIGQKLKAEVIKEESKKKERKRLEIMRLRRSNEELMDEKFIELEELKKQGSTGMVRLKQTMMQNDITLLESIDEYLMDEYKALFAEKRVVVKKDND